MVYTNPIIGRWLDEAGHPEARSYAIGPPPILDEQGNPVLDESGEPTYEDGPDRYEVRGWDKSFGDLPSEDELEKFTPAPVVITPPEKSDTTKARELASTAKEEALAAIDTADLKAVVFKLSIALDEALKKLGG